MSIKKYLNFCFWRICFFCFRVMLFLVIVNRLGKLICRRLVSSNLLVKCMVMLLVVVIIFWLLLNFWWLEINLIIFGVMGMLFFFVVGMGELFKNWFGFGLFFVVFGEGEVLGLIFKILSIVFWFCLMVGLVLLVGLVIIFSFELLGGVIKYFWIFLFWDWLIIFLVVVMGIFIDRLLIFLFGIVGGFLRDKLELGLR